MPSTSSRSRRALSGLLLALALGAAFLAVPASPAGGAPAAARPDGADPQAAKAEAALAAAQASLRGKGRDTTLALRDLALLRAHLPERSRAEADDLLRRPTNGGDRDAYQVAEETPECSAVVCVHYVASTQDAPALKDTSPANGVPDYVDRTLATFTHVHNSYVGAGYRAPRPDGSRGGNALPDVYIANIDDDYLYGYCTTDQNVSGHQPAWAYCVVDDDYANFQRNTPLENLRVTAAHEYFHAVQFGYDIAEDPWFLEATATWAEDELYDSVDDNRQYLRSGPTSLPYISLDRFGDSFHYGTWIFFRYLTERWPVSAGGLPTLVRDMWRRADAKAGAPDDYSLEAVERILAAKKATLPTVLAGFTRANRAPGRFYEEGSAYPASPLAGTIRFTSSRTSWSGFLDLDHLTGATARFAPTKSLRGSWKLRVGLDLTAPKRGGAAILTVQPTKGKPTVKAIRLDRRGDAVVRTNLTRGQVKWVEINVVNAGNDFRCNRGTVYSCSGISLDDALRQRFSAKVTRS